MAVSCRARRGWPATGLGRKPDPSVAALGHYVLADIYSRRGRENEAAREVARAPALERGR